ncbi:MAG: N-6 DNA methylase, partial [Candidatus Latescibacter sp.]|nr:N-6 DNA methylase [Candidatus Latescibacter sp.]
NLFGNILIEFEHALPKNRSEAEEQLKRYTAILWSKEPPFKRTPYICITADGVRFVAYTPLPANPEAQGISSDDITLVVLEECDWKKLNAEEIFYWLDRYFLRKEILHPTGESIVKDFGLKSHAFQAASHDLLSLWNTVKSESSFAVVYESWGSYLRIVYGSDIGEDALFIRHTYLATVAKLMAWMRITDSKTAPEKEGIMNLLSGRLFKSQGIENFIEEDFFSWPSRPQAEKITVGIVRKLFSLLQNYNLRELSEDVLKSLYQELVDPETRHDLGEFYTPDWLAHRMVRKILDENPSASVFDPSCGSGTFLYLTIKEKRDRLGDVSSTLDHILSSVYGADIHPLAVIVAKTNYILALGDLIKKRRGRIFIPVYLADTIRLPERWAQDGKADYFISVNGRGFYVPDTLLHDPQLFDSAVELAKDFAVSMKGKKIDAAQFTTFLRSQNYLLAENEQIIKSVFGIADALKYFIEENRDTIWAFILKNIYKPLFFKQKFDWILGNPPWISYRYVDPEYQSFLKNHIVKEYQLLKSKAELITHLEIAVLFLLRAADLYLKSGGRIAFVLPKSIFYADQHDSIRRGTYKLKESQGENLLWSEVWDCEKVLPLFNVPSCVLFAEKKKTGGEIKLIPGEILTGRLERKNSSLEDAEKQLTGMQTEFHLHVRGKRSYWAEDKGLQNDTKSYYQDKFSQGATLVPRSFWFVKVHESPLGVNPILPLVETADRAIKEAKKDYKNVYFKDMIECQFLFYTLLSTDLIPFGCLGKRLVVLPVVAESDQFTLLDEGTARNRGYLSLARWLENAEKEWKQIRGLKADNMNIYERLDRYRGITKQSPNIPMRILYNTSGTYLTAAIVENKSIEFEIDGQVILINNFITDCKTYYHETENIFVADFLAAFLNSPEIDKLIKPMQSRGLWGPRDIHKKVFDLPIPQFAPEDSAHRKLVELGEKCRKKVQVWQKEQQNITGTNIGAARSKVRLFLKEELNEINQLVKQILAN